MFKTTWLNLSLIGLLLAYPAIAQEVAPVPPMRPENLEITKPSEPEQNQDTNIPAPKSAPTELRG